LGLRRSVTDIDEDVELPPFVLGTGGVYGEEGRCGSKDSGWVENALMREL
jgi:hypothetical protein